MPYASSRCYFAMVAVILTLRFLAPASAKDLDVLFLGDNGHHQPRVRFAQLRPAMTKVGITLTYTDDMNDVNTENLARYDALLLYANIDRIEPSQEKALLDYVRGGGGFVPLHCATYCFRNSDEVVALMGGQFKRHGTGTFTTKIAQPDHPIMKDFGGFESWDETYVHHLHNEKNRTVLAYRVDNEGREPWTWVRTQGEGRVFYTAWGHDQRTFGNPGFHNLVERGIRWAAGDDPALAGKFVGVRPFPVPKMASQRKDVAPFEYTEAGGKIPNYTKGERWGTLGDPITKMQKPLPAVESVKHFVVPEGFRVELFASEPDIGGKPIAMAWDERGRLWVAETYDYPNELQPPGKGRDRIRILEDTDGDWKADKFTVFAEKLSIPTSLTFYRGGVIVHDGTRTLYLKDTDGDDVSDERRVMFTGWSQGDTHGGVSNFQYGLDNWIWAMQGYNDSRPSAGGKELAHFRNGFFRFRPDGSEIEFVRSTNNNTWGLGMSEEGIIFGSTANRNPSVYMPIANRYYERVRGWAKSTGLGTIADTHLFKPVTENVRQVDQHGGYTAAAGHALYTARRYPQEYWNRAAFVNGPTGHLTGTFVLKPNGSDFTSTSPFNLLASDDQWSAPIMAEVGPDGNVWVIDWYNYIVQHNPTPRGFKTGKGNAYETVLRDKKHGRIYRVVYGDDSERPFSLKDASPEKLVTTLRHPTQLWRKHAQRLLVERRNTDIVPSLIDMVTEDKSVDNIGLNVGAIHALWALHGLGQLDGSNEAATKAAYAGLRHRSAGVRRNAVQVLPPDVASTNTILLADLLNDDDAQVRLAALLALADLPPSKLAGGSIRNSLAMAIASDDRWLRDAAVCAAATNAASFLPEVAAANVQPEGEMLETLQVVASHYGRGGPVDSIGNVVAQLKKSNPEIAGAVLSGIAAGWPKDKLPKMKGGLGADLVLLVERLPITSKGVVVKLARSWGSKRFDDYAATLSKALLSELANDQLAPKRRADAAKQLVSFRSQDDEVVTMLLEQLTPQTPPEVTIGIVEALKLCDTKKVGELVTARFAGLTPQTRAATITMLLSRPNSTLALLHAIEKGDALLSELTLDQKQALSSHPNKDVARLAKKLLQRGGALPNADRQAVLTAMLPITKKKGDAEQGKAIFKKNCANCHTHSGEGAKIGPDLTGMAVHPKAELLTHILDPSRDVEGNYRVYSVVTADGLVLNGLLASESKTAIELFDTKGKKQVVLREDIEALKASAKSLMPEGFEKDIPAKAMTNLLEFLTARGQFVPIDMSKVGTVASDRGMFFQPEGMVERMIFPDWKPKTFKKVPFSLTDPRDGKVKNTILLHGPNGLIPPKMPRSVTLPCNGPARAIHMLSGVSGWGFPLGQKGSVSMIVRLHYADGTAEDHELKNGIHFADYIRRVDVSDSEFAFQLRGQQIRYLAVHPKRPEVIKQIELVKGNDRSSPIVMAVTLETGGGGDH